LTSQYQTNLIYQKKYTEKIENYQPLAEEIQNMWQQGEVTVAPVTSSGTGVCQRTFIKVLTEFGIINP
jgi:hypothetical protein